MSRLDDLERASGPKNLKQLKAFKVLRKVLVLFVTLGVLCIILDHLGPFWGSFGPPGATKRFCLGHFGIKTGPKVDQHGVQEPSIPKTFTHKNLKTLTFFLRFLGPKASLASRWFPRWFKMPPKMEPKIDYEIGDFI